MRQRTLAQAVSFEGMALHTGTTNRLTLHPAPPDTGVVFRRKDLELQPEVEATVDSVARTERCTKIKRDGAEVSTVEHLLGALRGMGIDNCLIEIDGPEVPIGDGSAAPFVELIDRAGTVEQESERRVVRVKEPVWATRGAQVAVALPYDGFKLSVTFTNDHAHPVLGDLFAECELTPDVFRREIAPARTVGWLAEVEALRARGLALGATMEMAVVLSPDAILTPMRFPNEPARHKILDIVGDVSLAGYVHAHIVAVRPSHALNVELARLIRKSLLEAQRDHEPQRERVAQGGAKQQ